MNDQEIIDEIVKSGYAEWLINGLRTIVENQPDSICLCSISKDGNVLTGYYHCNNQDKAIIAHNIYSDCIVEMLKNNGLKFDDTDEEQEAEDDRQQ